ncbi:MAG TPA: class I SAM-dependent methyltransferase [Pseudomonadales bacterium]|nr:class I SAM-dependent methyltransferase [Pseudomonadales bacterium]
MSARTLTITPALHEYLTRVGVRESSTAAALRVETAKLPMAMMQISPEQAAFMQLVVKLLGVRRALEVGTFTGYSALAVAEAMPADGKLICCDVSDEWTSIGKKHWAAAGVAHKIDLRLAPAVTTLDQLLASGQANAFDFAFIDADKSNYDNYYERALKLVRVGGLIGIDNTLWNGAVVDASRQDADTKAIRALNEKVHADSRIDVVLLPIGDGLTLCRRR